MLTDIVFKAMWMILNGQRVGVLALKQLTAFAVVPQCPVFFAKFQILNFLLEVPQYQREISCPFKNKLQGMGVLNYKCCMFMIYRI